MLICIDAPMSGFPWRQVSGVFQAAVHAAAQFNMAWLIQNPNTPGIETLIARGRVRWRNEPWLRKGIEEVASIPTIIKRGWGDCDDLVAAKLGELWVKEGGPPQFPPWSHAKVYCRVSGNTRAHHVSVRQRDGSVLDLSRWAGM